MELRSSFRASLFVLACLMASSGEAETVTSKNPNVSSNAALQASALKTAKEDYRIGLGDVLQISVWREPELSVPSITVRSDGKISVPLLKEMVVDGLTPSELEKQLTEKLRPVVRDPEVTVLVQQVNSKKIYLLGAIRKEGTISLQRPMTVLQAIAEAGGFNEFAKTKKIYILRRQNGKQIRLAYDYQAVIRGSDLSLDVVLQPDDTLVVPR